MTNFLFTFSQKYANIEEDLDDALSLGGQGETSGIFSDSEDEPLSEDEPSTERVSHNVVENDLEDDDFESETECEDIYDMQDMLVHIRALMAERQRQLTQVSALPMIMPSGSQGVVANATTIGRTVADTADENVTTQQSVTRNAKVRGTTVVVSEMITTTTTTTIRRQSIVLEEPPPLGELIPSNAQRPRGGNRRRPKKVNAIESTIAETENEEPQQIRKPLKRLQANNNVRRSLDNRKRQATTANLSGQADKKSTNTESSAPKAKGSKKMVLKMRRVSRLSQLARRSKREGDNNSVRSKAAKKIKLRLKLRRVSRLSQVASTPSSSDLSLSETNRSNTSHTAPISHSSFTSPAPSSVSSATSQSIASSSDVMPSPLKTRRRVKKTANVPTKRYSILSPKKKRLKSRPQPMKTDSETSAAAEEVPAQLSSTDPLVTASANMEELATATSNEPLEPTSSKAEEKRSYTRLKSLKSASTIDNYISPKKTQTRARGQRKKEEVPKDSPKVRVTRARRGVKPVNYNDGDAEIRQETSPCTSSIVEALPSDIPGTALDKIAGLSSSDAKTSRKRVNFGSKKGKEKDSAMLSEETEHPTISPAPQIIDVVSVISENFNDVSSQSASRNDVEDQISSEAVDKVHIPVHKEPVTRARTRKKIIEPISNEKEQISSDVFKKPVRRGRPPKNDTVPAIIVEKDQLSNKNTENAQISAESSAKEQVGRGRGRKVNKANAAEPAKVKSTLCGVSDSSRTIAKRKKSLKNKAQIETALTSLNKCTVKLYKISMDRYAAGKTVSPAKKSATEKVAKKPTKRQQTTKETHDAPPDASDSVSLPQPSPRKQRRVQRLKTIRNEQTSSENSVEENVLFQDADKENDASPEKQRRRTISINQGPKKKAATSRAQHLKKINPKILRIFTPIKQVAKRKVLITGQKVRRELMEANRQNEFQNLPLNNIKIQMQPNHELYLVPGAQRCSTGSQCENRDYLLNMGYDVPIFAATVLQ